MVMVKLVLSLAETGSAMHTENRERQWGTRHKHEDDVERRTQGSEWRSRRWSPHDQSGFWSGRKTDWVTLKTDWKKRRGIRSLASRALEDASVKFTYMIREAEEPTKLTACGVSRRPGAQYNGKNTRKLCTAPSSGIAMSTKSG